MQTWYVWIHAEWAGPERATSAWAERFAAALEHGRVRVRHAAQIGTRLVVEASVETQELEAASTAILSAIKSTGLATIVLGLEIADRVERERHSAVPELMGLGEVARLLKITSSRASHLSKSRLFPVPIARLSSGPIWMRRSIETWATAWKRRSGRPLVG